ncbi:MAG: XdhC family protein [Armatimonadetes bacterium]|nr:XdhC family protein [Armatimonadota bacterium]
MNDVIAKAVELHERGEQFCLAVVIAKSGSAPQVPGAKGLFLRDGRILGTIGGGCLEMESRRMGLQAMHTGRCVRREFQLDDDFGWDDGLICGGRVQVLLLPKSERFAGAFRRALEPRARGVLIYDLKEGSARFEEVSEADTHAGPRSEARNPNAENASRRSPVASRAVTSRREVLTEDEFAEPVLPPERLVIFGGGHIGKELSRLGATLGFTVSIVDDRAAFVSEERVPWADDRVCELPHRFAAELKTDADTFICIVTRGHRNDAKVLRELIQKPRAYLGMIGSRRKREVIKKEMVADGICTEKEFDRVQCPMGVVIGAESVEEISVSIAAELVRVRADRRGPILARCGQKQLEDSFRS